ncbi:MAG: hypothetical protein HUU46_15710 [Candidatus Hydrogenedentes bacterium]|nr:hypothetical protein [Candidatus Hydrogenedentota bacterium]
MATLRAAELDVQTLDGTVTVAYKKHGRDWHATALQFDLVGTGGTRETALRELQELFETYLSAVLETKGRVRFYNPSDAQDWEVKDKEYFRVVCIVSAESSHARSYPAPSLDDIDTLRRIKSRIKSVKLTPLLIRVNRFYRCL